MSYIQVLLALHRKSVIMIRLGRITAVDRPFLHVSSDHASICSQLCFVEQELLQ